LAEDEEAWFAALSRLVGDAALRAKVAQAAYHVSLARFGPEAQAGAFGRMLAQIEGGAAGAAAFEQDRYRASLPAVAAPFVPDSEVLFARDRMAAAQVCVIVPVQLRGLRDGGAAIRGGPDAGIAGSGGGGGLLAG
jgi:hypothetical protein